MPRVAGWLMFLPIACRNSTASVILGSLWSTLLYGLCCHMGGQERRDAWILSGIDFLELSIISKCFFPLGYSGKCWLLISQKHHFMLLGFWDNFLIRFTVMGYVANFPQSLIPLPNQLCCRRVEHFFARFFTELSCDCNCLLRRK